MELQEVISLRSGKLSEYANLIKPRMLLMVLITTTAGFYLSANSQGNVWNLIHILLGTALIGAGSYVMNQWYECVPDSKMRRTQNRPLPSGRLEMEEAKTFGLVVSFVGFVYIALTLDLWTLLLGFAAWSLYIFVYTPLKQKTPLNTWVGAIPGAIPPVMGWAAAQGSWDSIVLVIFGILFFWQLPHFFAISWIYKEDYQNAGFRMLSLGDDTGYKTGLQMLVNVVALIAVSLAPYGMRQMGNLYLMSAALLGCFYLLPIVFFLWHRSEKAARKVFFASLLYLPILLTMMMVDQL